ncbi:hypothetical protein PIB30_008254 [Stylosanthes scabra]|uniref:Uncharacterized protein n=1 Tax=Stylosanthes scabra TaxID=79078 RepID=A0ABU6R4T5_9FABA|nr:hypothetical protein [Stylosanthes scabra]
MILSRIGHSLSRYSCAKNLLQRDAGRSILLRDYGYVASSSFGGAPFLAATSNLILHGNFPRLHRLFSSDNNAPKKMNFENCSPKEKEIPKVDQQKSKSKEGINLKESYQV